MRTKVTFSMNKRFTFWSGKWWVLIIALQIWWTLTNLCCKSAAYSQNRNHLYLCNYIHCLMARHMQQEYRQGIDTGKPVIVWKSCFTCDCAYWCSRIGWRAGQEKLWHPTMWAQSYSVIKGENLFYSQFLSEMCLSPNILKWLTQILHLNKS